jgi:hypothetical protein
MASKALAIILRYNSRGRGGAISVFSFFKVKKILSQALGPL